MITLETKYKHIVSTHRFMNVEVAKETAGRIFHSASVVAVNVKVDEKDVFTLEKDENGHLNMFSEE